MSEPSLQEFIDRVYGVLRCDLATAARRIAGETEIQVLTQAMDVAEPERRELLRARINKLTPLCMYGQGEYARPIAGDDVLPALVGAAV